MGCAVEAVIVSAELVKANEAGAGAEAAFAWFAEPGLPGVGWVAVDGGAAVVSHGG